MLLPAPVNSPFLALGSGHELLPIYFHMNHKSYLCTDTPFPSAAPFNVVATTRLPLPLDSLSDFRFFSLDSSVIVRCLYLFDSRLACRLFP